MNSDGAAAELAQELVAALAGAAEDGERAVILDRHGELLTVRAAVQLTEIARERIRVNALESLHLAEAALAIAGRIEDQAARARALRAKANACWFLNRNQEAIDLYEESASLFQELGDETEVGRTLSSAIQPLIRLGEYERALEGAARARAIFEAAGDRLRLARLELNVANVLHRQDRFAEAFDSYERAYRVLAEMADTEGIAVALHNMAVCLIVLNDFEKAMATYREATAFFQEHGMPALAAQADYNIAYLYYLRGDYSRALAGLWGAREAAEKSGDAYHSGLCAADRSEIYLELNMNPEAAEAAREAFDQFQRLKMGYEAAKALANLAIAEGRMERTGRSLELFSEARAMFVAENNTVWPSLLDLYQALVLYDAGRNKAAAALASAALKFFHDRKMRTKEILCELLLGRIALDARDPNAARTRCAGALALLDEVEAPHLLWQAQLLMGRVEEASGAAETAEERYRAALEEAESLRSVLRGEELKMAFMKGKLEIYEGLVRLCLRKGPGGGRSGEAFAYMEQAKSRSLRDLLMRGGAALESPREESAPARQVRELRQELNWRYRRLESEETNQGPMAAERVRRLRGEIRDRERSLMAMVRDIPSIEAEKGGIPSSPELPVESMRAALDDETSLVEYYTVGDRLYAAILTRTDLHVTPLARLTKVAGPARFLQFQLSKFRLGSRYVGAAPPDLLLDATRRHLERLHRELLAPIRKRLHGSHLVFVLHEPLHHIPMHALLESGEYLIDRYSISYAPSASIHALCAARSGDEPGRQRSLILGAPDPRAPFIRDEVEAVAEILPEAELLIGAEATRAALEERAPHCRVLHIATHGRFRQDHPMFSAIRLGDVFLTIYDLDRMCLPVDLATLSGCSTGLSVVASGDELVGLMRGLLHAGARSLLLTLWDVQDRTAAELMKCFYRRYTSGERPAAALRKAMREIRETNPHPYFWAPFVLIGRR